MAAPCRAIMARPRFRTGAVEQPVALPVRGKAGRLAARGILPVARRGPGGLDHGAETAGEALDRSMRISGSLTSDHAPMVDRLSNTLGGRIRARDDDSVAGELGEENGEDGDGDDDDNDLAQVVDDEDVAMGRSQPIRRKGGGQGYRGGGMGTMMRTRGLSRLQLAAAMGGGAGAAPAQAAAASGIISSPIVGGTSSHGQS